MIKNYYTSHEICSASMYLSSQAQIDSKTRHQFKPLKIPQILLVCSAGSDTMLSSEVCQGPASACEPNTERKPVENSAIHENRCIRVSFCSRCSLFNHIFFYFQSLMCLSNGDSANDERSLPGPVAALGAHLPNNSGVIPKPHIQRPLQRKIDFEFRPDIHSQLMVK